MHVMLGRFQIIARGPRVGKTYSGSAAAAVPQNMHIEQTCMAAVPLHVCDLLFLLDILLISELLVFEDMKLCYIFIHVIFHDF